MMAYQQGSLGALLPTFMHPLWFGVEVHEILFSCTSTPNHNIHGENGVYQRWTICVKNWSQKVYQKCLFQRSGDQNFKKNSPWCPNDSTKSKETQSLGKNSCREKCLDKSLLTLSLEIFGTFIVPPGRKLRPKGNIVSTVMIFNGVR